MAAPEYSYRLKRVVALLSEEEWSTIADLLWTRLRAIKDFRRETGCSLPEAVRSEPVGQRALDAYEGLTGCRLDHPDELWAVRRSDYGPPCPACRRPLRTRRAKMCAECGHVLAVGPAAAPRAPGRT